MGMRPMTELTIIIMFAFLVGAPILVSYSIIKSELRARHELRYYRDLYRHLD